MELIISKLVGGFERGRLSRRQLIEGLTLLVASSAATQAPAAAPTSGLRATGVDHVSVQVADVDRSVEFYSRVFNMKSAGMDKLNRIARVGNEGIVVSFHPAPGRPGVVDHFCLKIADFNREKAQADLERQGIEVHRNIFQGFHVKDPDGVNVQMA